MDKEEYELIFYYFQTVFRPIVSSDHVLITP